MTVLYFIKPVGCETPIKVGISNDPERRLQQLMCWSPVELEIIATVPADGRIEARIHRMLIATHWRKEWFHKSAALDLLIARVRGGTFDPADLPEDDRPLWYERHAAHVEQRWASHPSRQAAA